MLFGLTRWKKMVHVFEINLITLQFITSLGKQAVPEEVHLLKLLKKSLESQYKTSFNEILNKDTGSSCNGGNELGTYAKIKNNYAIEPYMKCNFPPSIKRSITQLRLSSHDLEIERGRRTRPKRIPACERYCHQCTTKVETETHFVIECPTYDDIRNEIIFYCTI